MSELRSRWSWLAAGVLAALAIMAVIWNRGGGEIAPDGMPVRANVKTDSGIPDPEEGAVVERSRADPPPRQTDAPSSAPVTAQNLAERARAARNIRPHDALVRRRTDSRFPCQSMLGSWRLEGGEHLTLEAAGVGTWQHRATGGKPFRWLCMQDGTAELQLDDGTWRLVSEAEGRELAATDPRGARIPFSRDPSSR